MRKSVRLALVGVGASGIAAGVFAHGNVTPQPVDTGTLPEIGEA